MKIRTPIHDNYFLVDFLFGIRNNTKSSHIEPYFAADKLWTNEKPAPEMEPSDLIGPKFELSVLFLIQHKQDQKVY